jgi:hypothetical protein
MHAARVGGPIKASAMHARVMGLAAAINLHRPSCAEGNVGMEHNASEPMMSSADFNLHPPRRGIFLSALAACVLGLFGCGGQGGTENEPGASEGDSTTSSGDEAPAPNGVVNKSGSGSVTARIGSAGGSLTLSSGPKVEIPAGAIEGAEDVELSETQGTTAFLNQESERPIGPTFVVAPDIQAPSGKTIKVSIPLAAYPEGYGDVAIAYEYSEGARVGAEDSEHTRWQYEDAKLSGGRAVAELPAVNGYRLQFVLSNLEAQ